MPDYLNMRTSAAPDLIIVGGGLAGLLTAWRCCVTGAASQVLILEKSARIGGDQTWSFHESDVAPAALDWLRPMIAHEWPAYDVHFPAYSRQLDLAYMSSNSGALRSAVAPFIESEQIRLCLEAEIQAMTATNVTLSSGDTFSAPAVINATGFSGSPHRWLGYQKFVGHVVRTKAPHGLARPIIMDAAVPQGGGYRFVYCLPYSADEVLIEDTYYEDEAALETTRLEARINAYAAAKGWEIADILHREQGVLPITLASDIEAQLASETGAPRIGLAGGLYHAVTGYSFADAVRMAMAIGDIKDMTANQAASIINAYRRDHWRRERFFRLLNRMLFRAGKPEDRYQILQRFYRLSETLIRDFYAGELDLPEKIRLLSGRPPVPILGALRNLSERQFIRHSESTD